MILGIGIDLIAINRIGRVFSKHKSKFVDRVLSAKEKETFHSLVAPEKKINFLAKRFSAKESLLKAMGVGMGRGLNMFNITIDRDDFKKPIVIIDDEKKTTIEKILNEKFERLNFLISLTDENNMVGAFVIIDKIK